MVHTGTIEWSEKTMRYNTNIWRKQSMKKSMYARFRQSKYQIRKRNSKLMIRWDSHHIRHYWKCFATISCNCSRLLLIVPSPYRLRFSHERKNLESSPVEEVNVLASRFHSLVSRISIKLLGLFKLTSSPPELRVLVKLRDVYDCAKCNQLTTCTHRIKIYILLAA